MSTLAPANISAEMTLSEISHVAPRASVWMSPFLHPVEPLNLWIGSFASSLS